MTYYTPDSLPFITLLIIDVKAPPANWPNKVAVFQAAMASGQKLPPTEVTLGADGRYGVADGVHRYHAAKRCGHSHIPAVVLKQEVAPSMRVLT